MKRIISACLAATMLFTVTACVQKKTAESNDTTDTTVIAETLPIEIERQNYNGSINILMPDWGLYVKYFDPGNDKTDIMNKALYTRELKVEEYLGVNIGYEHVPTINDIVPAVATAITTNDDLYQIVLSHCISGNAQMIMNGQVADMNDMDIDFSAEWFNQKANEALSVAGKQFYCISDYMLPDPNVVLFNKKLLEEAHLEDPYQLVRDGKWTIDKMAELSSAITADNGDTVWDHNDTYGFSAPGQWYLNSFMFGADVDFIEKNDAGEFELVFGNEHSYTIMEKLEVLLDSPDTYFFDNAALTGDSAARAKAITIDSGRCLFTLMSLNILHTVRDVETDFGILPYPKLDEAQENYIANDWSGLMSVPMSVNPSSYKMVGDVIELLAYYSEEEVIPTYIDLTLGTKLARDTDSREMIQLVFDSVEFNAGMNYFGNLSAQTNMLFYTVNYMFMLVGQNYFASYLAAYESGAEATIAEFNEAVRNLN